MYPKLLFAISMVFALFISAVLSQPVSAEEGCPDGRLMSPLENRCVPLSSYNVLPLDDRQPMVFQAIQISMMRVTHQAIGTITADTPEAFRRFLRSSNASYSKELHLHSPGGDLVAALELGQLVREAGLSTHVGRSIPLDGLMDVYDYNRPVCASACAYAFLGGTTRSFGPEAVFGVHRFGSRDFEVKGDVAQVMSSLLAVYVDRMGVNPRVLELASSRAFENDLYVVTPSLAQELRIIFDPAGITEFRVEERDGAPWARFEVSFKEYAYRGAIYCSGGHPTLALMASSEAFPPGLEIMQDFPATFSTGTGELRARANYHRSPDTGGALVWFKIPELSPRSFSPGLSLQDINNPTLRPVPSDVNGDPVLGEEFFAVSNWAGAVTQFMFHIAAENGERTLPLVIRRCR